MWVSKEQIQLVLKECSVGKCVSVINVEDNEVIPETPMSPDTSDVVAEEDVVNSVQEVVNAAMNIFIKDLFRSHDIYGRVIDDLAVQKSAFEKFKIPIILESYQPTASSAVSQVIVQNLGMDKIPLVGHRDGSVIQGSNNSFQSNSANHLFSQPMPKGPPQHPSMYPFPESNRQRPSAGPPPQQVNPMQPRNPHQQKIQSWSQGHMFPMDQMQHISQAPKNPSPKMHPQAQRMQRPFAQQNQMQMQQNQMQMQQNQMQPQRQTSHPQLHPQQLYPRMQAPSSNPQLLFGMRPNRGSSRPT